MHHLPCRQCDVAAKRLDIFLGTWSLNQLQLICDKTVIFASDYKQANTVVKQIKCEQSLILCADTDEFISMLNQRTDSRFASVKRS